MQEPQSYRYPEQPTKNCRCHILSHGKKSDFRKIEAENPQGCIVTHSFSETERTQIIENNN